MQKVMENTSTSVDSSELIMATLPCRHCERPATSACGCSFPLPLLCEGHLADHSDHGHLPLSASRWVRDQQTQIKLRDKLAILSKLYEPLKLYCTNEQQIAPCIRERLMEFDRNVKELASIVNNLKAEVHEGESSEQSDSFCSLIWDFPEGELGTWASIGRGLSLQTEYKYAESCRVLESRWEWSERVETLVLGLALGEVMGLHIGRFREALAVLDRSLQLAAQLFPLSETALQITNVKTAVFIHMMEEIKLVELCKETIQSFCEESVSEVTYGTMLYFFMVGFLYCFIPFEYEILIRKWVARTEGSSSTLIQFFRLCIIAMLKVHEGDTIGAESRIKEAEEQAKVHFPTSNFAALSSYSRMDLEKNLYSQRSLISCREENPCLRTHFPASLLRASILIRNAADFECMEDIEKAYELRIQAIPIVKGNTFGFYFFRNFDILAKALIETKQIEAALDLYYFAIRGIIANDECDYSFAHDFFREFSNFLKYQMPERQLPVLTELLSEAQVTCPQRKLFAQILDCISETHGDTSLETLEEKYLFLRTNYPNSDSYQQTLEILIKVYSNHSMNEKSMEIYLERIQFIRAHQDCKSYMQIVTYFEKLYWNYKMDNKFKVLLEAYRFLIANYSIECWKSLSYLEKYYKDQPDTILSLNLEAHQVLQLTPTCEEYNMSLVKLTDLYKDRNQLKNAIQLRLEAYQVLLAHLDSSNFIENVDALAECYEAMGENEAADELRLKVRQLVLAGPPIYLLQRNLISLWKLNLLNYQSLIKFLKLYHLQGGNQAIPSNYEQIYCEKGDMRSMIRLLLKCIELSKTFTLNFNDVVESIGHLYLRLGEREAAIQLSVQTLHYCLEHCFLRRAFDFRFYLDEIFIEIGQLDKAIELRELVLCVHEKHGFFEDCSYISRELAFRYEENGQREKQITATLNALRFWLLVSYRPNEAFEAHENAVRLYWKLNGMDRVEPLCILLVRSFCSSRLLKGRVHNTSIREIRNLYSVKFR